MRFGAPASVSHRQCCTRDWKSFINGYGRYDFDWPDVIAGGSSLDYGLQKHRSPRRLLFPARRARETRRAQAIEDIEVIYYDSDEVNDSSDETTWLKQVCGSLKRNDPTVDRLDIDADKSSLCDDDIMAIYDALVQNHVLSNINFRNIKLKMDATLNLAPILQNSQSLQLLHIEESGTKEQIAVAMALSLSSISSIRILSLRGNHIDYKSAEALGLMLKSNVSLSELRFCHNRIDVKGILYIAEGLENNSNLRILDLSENGLNDEAVTKLMESISCNKSLKFLCLDFNDFGYDGIRSIASMIKNTHCLKEFHLFGNRINESGAELLAEALCHNSSLNSLILSYNQIGDVGAVAFARALTLNSSLTKIWFPSNGIGNNGLQTFGRLLPKMMGLEQLCVGDLFDNFAAQELLEGLKSNTRLSVLYIESPVSENNLIEDELDFYIRLNKSGRSLLQTPNAPISLWAEALGRANSNVSKTGTPDALFQMLRQKPDLFDFVR
eukprot:scaffold1119_cov120-Cylindrotheca_fusiformis.AAC.2